MKKGFTLIELLAVIVILAIISVIAVPIVLNVIDSSEESAAFSNAEFYINALNDQIMLKDLNENEEINPTMCTITEDGNANCDGVVLKIEMDGAKPHYGIIVFKDSKVVEASLAFDGITIKTNSEGNFVNTNTLKICEPVTEATKTTGNIPQGKYLPGDEYICEVGTNLKYHFFVLSKSGNKINLILDKNINSDGTLVSGQNGITKKIAENGVYNLVEWISPEDYLVANKDKTECDISDIDYDFSDGPSCNDEGPVTVLNYINEALQFWTNISNLNETYKDKNINKTMKLTGKARLPYYNEVIGNGKCPTKSQVSEENKCPNWLINYLGKSADKEYERILGYWLMTSTSTNDRAWTVKLEDGYFFVEDSRVHYFNRRGVRPVITLAKENFIE